MKARHVLIILIFLGLSGIVIQYRPSTNVSMSISSPKTAFSSASGIIGCDETLWQHIYNPQRLQIIEKCKSVIGTIEVIRVEKDGDYHILLKEDHPQLINQVNIDKQHGDLVIEPICENPVTQQDTLDQGVCNNFHQNFHLNIGDYIKVTGDYVLDTQHGWNEVHPITSIESIK